MKRYILNKLENWKDAPSRKPMLLRGARQVGKTWIARELGKQFDDFIEINFELYPEAKKIFDFDLDPKRISRDLSLLFGKRFTPETSLIFFDEIQEEPKAIQALRYFYEMLPEQHIIAAGSLLDFELEKIGMPVGRVSSIYVHPMSFFEFLVANEEFLLIEMIAKHDTLTMVSDPIHNKLLRLLGDYMAIGGMPEAVAHWINEHDPHACASIHRAIIDAYRQDFNKYAKKYQIKYVNLLFDTIPAFLGKIFKFNNVPGANRKRDLLPSLELLIKAGLAHKIIHTAAQGIPLGAQAKPDIFKLVFLDIALAQTILGLDASSWIIDPEATFANKGEITEAFVGQEMLACSAYDQKPQLYFWKRQARASSAEIDYVMQQNQQVIPIEIKSASPGRLKSLRLFLHEHPNSPYGVRFSTLNYAADDKLRSIPLYAVASQMNFPRELIQGLL